MIFNVMERDYWLVASFTDANKCKEYVKDKPKAYWVGVWPDGPLEHAIPMWESDDFINNFPHAETSEKKRLSYSF